MKKIYFLSITVAALVMNGCSNDTKSVAAQAGKTTPNTASAVVDTAQKKAAEAVETTKETAVDAAEAAKQKVTETTKETVAEAVDTVKEQTTEAVDTIRKKSTEMVETTGKTIAETADAAKTQPEKPAEAAVDPAKGKTLYAKCAGCHGNDGKMKALGKSNPIAGMAAGTLTADIKGYKAGTLNKYGLGSLMKTQVAGMSEEDIVALSTYIASLK